MLPIDTPFWSRKWITYMPEVQDPLHVLWHASAFILQASLCIGKKIKYQPSFLKDNNHVLCCCFICINSFGAVLSFLFISFSFGFSSCFVRSAPSRYFLLLQNDVHSRACLRNKKKIWFYEIMHNNDFVNFSTKLIK